MSTTPSTIADRNRANAQHSTGPKTPAGKSVVSQNARKFGLFVSDATLEHEESADFADIFAQYIAEYRPVCQTEEELVRQLSMATHRLRRLDRIENAAMFTPEISHTRHEASVIMKEKWEREQTLIENIERARTRAERTFNRAKKDLEDRQRRRFFRPEQPTNLEIELDSRHLPEKQNKPSFYGRQEPAPPKPEPVSAPDAPETVPDHRT